MATRKVRIRITDNIGTLQHGDEIDALIENVKCNDSEETEWTLYPYQYEIIEEPELKAVDSKGQVEGLPKILGQRLKRLEVEFE